MDENVPEPADVGADEIMSEIQADDYYAIVPEWILFHPDLSHGAVRLYGVLRRFADQRGIAFPGLTAIGLKYGVVARSATRHMDELITAGAVTKKRRIGRNGKVTSNLYRVHTRPTFIEVAHDYTPDTTAATAAVQAQRTDLSDEPRRTEVSDGPSDRSVRRSTDKNVRLTTAILNHSQDEPQDKTPSASSSPSVTPENATATTRNSTIRPTPDQKLTAAGLSSPRDRGRFREYLRTVKDARNTEGVIMAAAPEDLASQVREWRRSLDVTAEPDAEPVLCDHGHDIALGAHMCPACRRPAAATPDVEPERTGAPMPAWLREALDGDPALAVAGALAAGAGADQ